MIIRFLIYALLIYLFFRLVKSVFFSSLGGGKAPGDPKGSRNIEGEQMVQDPVCESYVPKSEAVTLSKGGKEYFFCSNECKDKFSAGSV